MLLKINRPQIGLFFCAKLAQVVLIPPSVQISPGNSISENFRISCRFRSDFKDHSYSDFGALRSQDHARAFDRIDNMYLWTR